MGHLYHSYVSLPDPKASEGISRAPLYSFFRGWPQVQKPIWWDAGLLCVITHQQTFDSFKEKMQMWIWLHWFRLSWAGVVDTNVTQSPCEGDTGFPKLWNQKKHHVSWVSRHLEARSIGLSCIIAFAIFAIPRPAGHCERIDRRRARRRSKQETQGGEEGEEQGRGKEKSKEQGRRRARRIARMQARKQKHSWAAQPQGPHKVGNQSNHGLQPQRLAMPTLSFTTISIQACLSGGLLANFPVPPFQVFGWMLVDVSQLWPVDFVYLRGLMLRGLMILMIGIPWKQYGDDTCSKVFIHCIT